MSEVPAIRDSGLVRTGVNPLEVIDKAQEIADKLKGIIEKAGLVKKIQKRDYVEVEGWTTMLAMLGVTPQVEYCRSLKRDNEIAYEARVNLITLDGRTVGSGEAMCSSEEKNWRARDEYAIKSMAQTRATGKAARLSFSWVMKLAGYEATPQEEMPDEDHVVDIASQNIDMADSVQALQKIFQDHIDKLNRKEITQEQCEKVKRLCTKRKQQLQKETKNA